MAFDNAITVFIEGRSVLTIETELIEGEETLQGLNHWLRRSPGAEFHDRLVAQSLADELGLVLRGAG